MLNSNNFAEQNWKCKTKIRRGNSNRRKIWKSIQPWQAFFFPPHLKDVPVAKWEVKLFSSGEAEQSSGPHWKFISDFVHHGISFWVDFRLHATLYFGKPSNWGLLKYLWWTRSILPRVAVAPRELWHPARRARAVTGWSGAPPGVMLLLQFSTAQFPLWACKGKAPTSWPTPWRDRHSQ